MVGKPKPSGKSPETVTRQAKASKRMGEMLQQLPFVDKSKKPVKK